MRNVNLREGKSNVCRKVAQSSSLKVGALPSEQWSKPVLVTFHEIFPGCFMTGSLCHGLWNNPCKKLIYNPIYFTQPTGVNWSRRSFPPVKHNELHIQNTATAGCAWKFHRGNVHQIVWLLSGTSDSFFVSIVCTISLGGWKRPLYINNLSLRKDYTILVRDLF